MSERINVEVDDTQIVATIALLDSAIAKSELTLSGFGGVGGLKGAVESAKIDLEAIMLEAGALTISSSKLNRLKRKLKKPT